MKISSLLVHSPLASSGFFSIEGGCYMIVISILSLLLGGKARVLGVSVLTQLDDGMTSRKLHEKQHSIVFKDRHRRMYERTLLFI